MSEFRKPLLDAFKAKQGKIPFWFMRQAGRYLPEYKQVRKGAKHFLDMCYDPALATEVTLQPIRRFGMHGAIIFSDILVVPHAMGIDVRFVEGEGPVLAPVRDMGGLERTYWNSGKLASVYDALRLTRARLPQETTLLGFAGSPWTLACYVVQGKSDKDFGLVRDVATRDSVFFVQLIDALTEAVTQHCLLQIEAGANVIQLFDSWSGVLQDESMFERWVIEPTARIVSTLKRRYPHVPVIGFPRMAGMKYLPYVKQTGIDGVNIDASVPLAFARDALQPLCLVQGGLDNVLLAENQEAMLAQAKEIISVLANGHFIFNLGHGILPHTPVTHVQALCDFLHSYDLR